MATAGLVAADGIAAGTLALEPRLARPWVALAPSPVADGVGSRVTLQALAPASGKKTVGKISAAADPKIKKS